MSKYRVICDRTGKKLWNYQCEVEWDNLFVWKDAIDPFPEYLIVPNTQENLAVPIVRTEGEDVFLTPNPATDLLHN